MIITLIAFGILILGIILTMISNKLKHSYEILRTVGGSMAAVGSIMSLIVVMLLIVAQCNVNERIYKSDMEYESLVKQVEAINSDYEDVSKTEVIRKVYDWNIYVHNYKYYSENPWTNWFNSKRLADSLKYIEWRNK